MIKCPDPNSKDKKPPVEVAMGDTYTEISRRLAKFRPGVRLGDHVKCFIEEADSLLDGFTFKAKNADLLIEALKHCQAEGQKAFAMAKNETQKGLEKHFPIAASFLKTHGVGFREIWRGPVLSDRPLTRHPDLNITWADDVGLPDISSLHCAVAADVCNIHIDQMGFVIEDENGELVVDPDALEHIVNELWLKTDLKGYAPKWMGGAFDRLSLILPDSRNGYSRMGPRIGQIPYVRDIEKLPGIGKIVGKIPLPGLSFDLVKTKRYRVRLTGSCGLHGDCEGMVEISGTLP